MNHELPEGWARARIADVTEHVPNTNPEDCPEKDFGYVDISSIDNSSFAITEIKRLRGKDAPSRARRPVRPNDTLFSNVRTYLRNIALVPEGSPAEVCSTGFTVLRPNKAVDPRYLFRYVLTDAFIDRVTPQQTGTHYPAASDRVVMAEQIPLAPLNEQRRIVPKLEKLLGKVDACQKRLAKIPVLLKRFRQSVLAAACSGRLTAEWRERAVVPESAQEFLEGVREVRRQACKTRKPGAAKGTYSEPDHVDSTGLPDIPESWEWASANATCAQITDGEHIQPPYQSEGRPMLSAKHVRDGFVTLEGAGLISEPHFRKALERCEPQNGDVLIVSVGATTGRSAIVKNCPAFAIVRSVLLLKPLIPARFFLHWLQSPWCFSWMTQASGASAQPHLYIKDTKRMPVPIPPLAEQREIVRRVGALFALADQIQARTGKAKAHVDKLTQSFLAKAFRGELVPTEAELARRQGRHYEPASVLLVQLKTKGKQSGQISAETRHLARRRSRRQNASPAFRRFL
jgi:type I restriction enzyme S subunit